MNALIIILSLILCVVIGGFFVTFLHKTNKAQIIKLLLAFSGGFLLSIAFTHFIPDLYDNHNHNIGIFILIGFLIQLLLEFFSGGIEHGHIHVHKGQKMPWGMFLSLSIHSVLEGIPLGHQFMGYAVNSHHHGTDNSLLLGILFHQLPVAITLMTLLVNTKLNTLQAWIVLILFGIMTPIGFGIGIYTKPATFNFNSEYILAVVVGMFLHISTTIIFETTENHKFNLLKLMSIFLGCSVAFGM